MSEHVERRLAAILSALIWAPAADAARIKDLVNVSGVRANKLIGFGLVIGLANTRDQATNVFFSIQNCPCSATFWAMKP